MALVFHATFAALLPEPSLPAAEVFVPTPEVHESIFEALPEGSRLTSDGEYRDEDDDTALEEGERLYNAVQRGGWRQVEAVAAHAALRNASLKPPHPDSVVRDDPPVPVRPPPPRHEVPTIPMAAVPPPSAPAPLPARAPAPARALPTPARALPTPAPVRTKRVCVKDVLLAYQLGADDRTATARVRDLNPSREVLRTAVRALHDAGKACPGLEAYCAEVGTSPLPLPPGRGRPKPGDRRTYLPQKVPKRDSYFIRLPLDYFRVTKDTVVEVEFGTSGMQVEVRSSPR